jgi:translation initiation factor IF-1
MKEDIIRVEGKITEVLSHSTYRVELEGKHKILAYKSGKMRMHFIKLLPGDKVVVELSLYDTNRGRIILRKE